MTKAINTMTDAESEFLNAIAATQPLYIEPLEYRIYYNVDGNITSCSMQSHEPGTYIVVSQHDYENYFRYTVVNRKLKKIESDPGFRVQLSKSTSGFPTVKNHANLIIEQDETYTDIEYYEYRVN
jgi:hypothetical protein